MTPEERLLQTEAEILANKAAAGLLRISAYGEIRTNAEYVDMPTLLDAAEDLTDAALGLLVRGWLECHDARCSAADAKKRMAELADAAGLAPAEKALAKTYVTRITAAGADEKERQYLNRCIVNERTAAERAAKKAGSGSGSGTNSGDPATDPAAAQENTEKLRAFCSSLRN